ncbi:hypothetical protein N478_03085 [Pseudoalteromonas luteoviolacea S4060-1]|uniref:Uncharacterized protein n=1 Tax=Pseudoalteromonas luteoviolacea S4060-1 TaxID=1365257 RepID=A0A167LQA4_9GAMM|nr:hypothetical protein N478_03085 [Pseudoalteromonas luteoviolacea S4060-1]
MLDNWLPPSIYRRNNITSVPDAGLLILSLGLSLMFKAKGILPRGSMFFQTISNFTTYREYWVICTALCVSSQLFKVDDEQACNKYGPVRAKRRKRKGKTDYQPSQSCVFMPCLIINQCLRLLVRVNLQKN